VKNIVLFVLFCFVLIVSLFEFRFDFNDAQYVHNLQMKNGNGYVGLIIAMLLLMIILGKEKIFLFMREWGRLLKEIGFRKFGPLELADEVDKALLNVPDELKRSEIELDLKQRDPISEINRKIIDIEKQAKQIKIEETDAIEKINSLVILFNRCRIEIERGDERTRLMTKIASGMMFNLNFVKTVNYFKEINSDSEGWRIVGYKNYELSPKNDEFFTLLSRALGVLETPFGQWSALIAFLRVVEKCKLSQAEADDAHKSLSIVGSAKFIVKGGEDRHWVISRILNHLNEKYGSEY